MLPPGAGSTSCCSSRVSKPGCTRLGPPVNLLTDCIECVPRRPLSEQWECSDLAENAKGIEKAWWDDWWAADWSWAGLATKQIGASGVAYGGQYGDRNLRDYWSRDPQTRKLRSDAVLLEIGELARAPDGTLWHVSHIPMLWRDGSAAKIGWDIKQRQKFLEIISRRIAEASETKTDSFARAQGAYGRAQFCGAILIDCPVEMSNGKNTVFLVMDGGALLDSISGVLFLGAGFRCEGSLFTKEINFSNTQIDGAVCFDHAKFLGGVNFSRASVTGNFRFIYVSICGDAKFDNAKFINNASFQESTFAGPANFSDAVFEKSARFNKATFLDLVRFDLANFDDDALFEQVKFEFVVRFDKIKFKKSVNFYFSSFLKDASFGYTSFSEYSTFHAAIFYSNVSFHGAEFQGTSVFTSVCFRPPPSGSDTELKASFVGCRFKDVADFTGAEFHRRMDFQATTFERRVQFDQIKLPESHALWQGMFSDAQFKDVTSFRGAGCRAFAAFDGAVFAGGLRLDDPGEANVQAQFEKELAQTLDVGSTAVGANLPSAFIAKWLVGAKALPTGLSARLAARSTSGEVNNRVHGTGLRSLEGGCRVLKQSMEKASDKVREQMFYAFELTARRHQQDISRAERLFSYAYAGTADYGRSIARPLWLLVLTIPLFTIFYWFIFYIQGKSTDSELIYQSLSLSFGRVFPFGLWQSNTLAYQTDVLQLRDTGMGLALRLLATLQSLLALIFAFLVGLALRRRFHIN